MVRRAVSIAESVGAPQWAPDRLGARLYGSIASYVGQLRCPTPHCARRGLACAGDQLPTDHAIRLRATRLSIPARAGAGHAGAGGYSATPIRVLLAGGACNAMAGRLGRRRLLADHVTAPARRLGGPHLPVRMHAVGWDRRKRASPAISAYGRSSGGAALRAAGALRADASCGAHCAGSPVVGRCYFGRWAALSVPAKVARATRERCRVNLQCL